MGVNRNDAAESGKSVSGLRTVFAIVSGCALFVAVLFLPAGRLDWYAGWIYLAVAGLNMAANYAYLLRVNPAVIVHRSRMGKGTKTWDKVWLGLFTLAFTSVYVVAGFDAGRYGWSDMPLWLWPVGLALLLLGTVFFTWAMAVNPFFEKTVRIQKEREHRVIDTGPYRYVRHPGYTGFFGWLLSAPLLLGSWWAFLPAAVTLAALIVRTALEDRTLHRELPGYAEYTSRVRYRLIPGVW